MTARVLVTLLALLAGANAGPPEKVAAAKTQRPAGDDRRRIIGILDVHVDGVPRGIAAQFQKNLEAQLDSNAYWLAPQRRMKEMLANSTKWTDGCVVGACLREVKVQTGAEVVLLASITGSGTSFGYVVTLVRTDTGAFVAQETDRCDVCTVSEALSSATLAAVKLVTALPEKFPDTQAEQKAAFDLTKKELVSDQAQTKSRHGIIGLTLTLTGVVAAGTGIALYVTQNQPNYALATAAAGAGLALGGVVVLTF